MWWCVLPAPEKPRLDQKSEREKRGREGVGWDKERENMQKEESVLHERKESNPII